MKREFLVERQGRPFVLYAGLLDEAHNQGLKAIRTQLIQAPNPENGNIAICFAEVTTEKGTFTGLGDAAPDNVSRMMVPHLIRMAETRAKARAMRDAVNIGVTALEELGEIDYDDRSVEPAQRFRDRPGDQSFDRAPARPVEPARHPAAPEAALNHSEEQAPRPQAAAARPAAPAPTAPTLDRPTPRAASTDGQPSLTSSILATPNQVKFIYNLAKSQRNLDEATVDEKSIGLYGATPAGLTRKQASDFIDAIKSSEPMP